MLSEDHTISLSDDERDKKDEEPAGLTGAQLLLDDGDEVNLSADSQPSRLRLDLSLETEVPLDGDSNVSKSTSSPDQAAALPVSISNQVTTKASISPNYATQDTPYTLAITVGDFEKRGEGINAYIVYKVVATCENVQGYANKTFQVWRRFSDFLGLHEKLMEKYLSKGVVVPYAPEKSIAAFTKTKQTTDVTKEVATPRARHLERWLRRVVQHPRMRSDCYVRDFLTIESELPKASNTAALSGAGVKRMFKSVGEVFSKMAFHMEEGDRWFEQTQSHVEELDESLRRLHHIVEGLAATRKGLAHAQEDLGRGLSMLASCEESTALARALSHLTETEESVGALWAKQAEADTIRLVERVGEYVGLVGALKDVFSERVRVWQSWQTSQQNLAKKRELKSRMELSGKTDRLAGLRAECDEATKRVDELETEFADISKLIREEVTRFETQRRQDFKTMMIDYLESILQTHQEMLRLWQKFEPETKAIIIN